MPQKIINQFAIIKNSCITCYDYHNLVTELALNVNTYEKLSDQKISDIAQLNYRILRISNPIVEQNGYVTYQESTKFIDFTKLNHDVFEKLQSKNFNATNWRVTNLKIPSQTKPVHCQTERCKSHTNKHLKTGRVAHVGLHAYYKYWTRCTDLVNDPIFDMLDKNIIKHQRRYAKQKLEWFDEWETYTARKSTGWKNTKCRHQYQK